MGKDLNIPAGLKNAQQKTVPTPMEKMLHHDSGSMRTSICVSPDLYKRFKLYAVEHDTSVTALITKYMEEVVGSDNTDFGN